MCSVSVCVHMYMYIDRYYAGVYTHCVYTYVYVCVCVHLCVCIVCSTHFTAAREYGKCAIFILCGGLQTIPT